MMQELQKFRDELEAQKTALQNTDVEAIVAEKLAVVADEIRSNVKREIDATSAVLSIKIEALTDAMALIEKSKSSTEEETTTLTPTTTETI